MSNDDARVVQRAIRWTVNRWTGSFETRLGRTRYWWHARTNKHGQITVMRPGRDPVQIGYGLRRDRVEDAIVLGYLGPRS